MVQLMIYEFFSFSTNFPRGLSAYKLWKLVVYCLLQFFTLYNPIYSRETFNKELHIF